MELLKPTVDLAFHRMLSQAGNEPVLLDLLNAVLVSSGDRPATGVTVMNPRIEPRTATDRAAVLDVRATLADGRSANVEMQVVNQGDWAARSLYYWARLFADQLTTAMPYRQLTPTISVGVLSFRLWPGGPFHHTFRLRADHDPAMVWSDHLALHTVELKKLPESFRPEDEELVRWMKFLMDGPPGQKEEIAMESPAIQQALTTLETLSYDQEFRALYEAREKAQRDLISMRADGLEEGRAEGREEGRAEGRGEGQEEATRVVAQAMLADGLPVARVAKITGLSLAEVQALPHE